MPPVEMQETMKGEQTMTNSTQKTPEQIPVDQLSFADALNELESIVSALEGNDLELEDSLARYERGVALLRALQGRLATAQQKIDVLHGQLQPEPTDEERDTTLS